MSGGDGINQILSEKLDKNNFHAWKFRMTNFLMGKGYWEYIDGDKEDAPEIPEEHVTAEQVKALKEWNQGARKVMYWLSVSIQDTMIGHIQDANSPKEAWSSLVTLFETSTKARKLQLKNDLNTVEKKSMSINDYALKIKSICESLASIGVSVDDDDKVEVCLRGLGPTYKQFKTSIRTRENIPCFADLVSMLIVEEKNLGEESSSQGKNSSEQVFYSNRGRGRGRGFGGGRGRGNQNYGQQQQQNQFSENQQTGGRGQFRGRGSQRGRGFQRQQSDRSCYYCGKPGHMQADCYKKQNDMKNGRLQQNNYASSSKSNEDNERLFVMQHMMNTMSTGVSQCRDNVWYVDSGASNHMTSHGEWFKDMQKMENAGYVETGDDTTHPIAHTGNVPLSMTDGKVKYLAEVLHVPNITKNLVSVGQMVEQGLQVRFNADGLFVEEYKKNGKLIAQGKKVGRMFTLDVNVPEVNAVMFAQGSGVVADIEIWHKRIGHANVQRLKTMQSRELVTGLPAFKVAEMQKVCEACQFGKQAKAAFPHDKHATRNVLELIHSDVWGPAKTASMGGCRFYVTFIDDHTRKVWVYFMKEKSEVFSHFQNFKVMVEKQTGHYVQCLRSDGGGEYFSNEFSSFLKKHGIQRQFSCRYTPQQNGVAERKNRHIAEVARALMAEKNMPHCYWAEAVSTAVYIMNRTPTAAVHDMTPEEKFAGRKPDLSHLKVFGCIAYVHVPDELRTKLDPKAEKCVFIGYSLEQKGYKCYNPVTRQVRVSRDVVFDEMAGWYNDVKDGIGADVKEDVASENTGAESQVLSGPQGSPNGSNSENPWSGRLRGRVSPSNSSNVSRKGKEKVDDAPRLPNLSAGHDDVHADSSGSDHSLDEEFGIPSIKTPGVRKMHAGNRAPGSDPGQRRSERVRNPVQRLSYDSYVASHCAFMAKIVQDVEPTCFDDAYGDVKWEKAMDEEMAALDANETWDLVPLPEGKNAIGCKWVYKIKHNADGSISRYKARLVAKGYAQTYGIDYEETFSPVAKMATVRVIISVAAAKGWVLHQMDVNNAFLNGDLHEEVYMEQPQGYKNKKRPKYVCKLKKALYGLKQSSRAWHERIVTYLVSIGFRMSAADHSLYVRENETGIVIVCIYVDDLIVGGDNEDEVEHVKTQLKQEFDMKDLGELRYFLGIEIIRTQEGIWLSQRQYALDMLSKYGMADCKPIAIPLDQNLRLRADVGQVLEDVTMYRKIVGSLLYLTISRPDLSYAVGLESQFMQTPKKPHLDAVRRTLRYVSATLDYALFYETGADLEIFGYTDADWAGSSSDRRSTSGFMFSLGSAAITWSSKKQPTVALSSTEAEYRGAAVAACEVAWLDMLLHDLRIQVQRPVVIYCDNLSSIQLARNPVFHARTKHIEVHYHFIRERVLAGDIDLMYVRTDEQIADIFTKALGAEKLRRFRAMLGVRELALSLRGSVETPSSTCGLPG